MSNTYSKDVFKALHEKALEVLDKEPILRGHFKFLIAECDSFSMCLSRLIASLLSSETITYEALFDICNLAFESDPQIIEDAAIDLIAVCERDPAVKNDFTVPFLYFKGYHALQSYRIAHWLYNQGRYELALYMQSIISHNFAVDIHPEAKIGHGIMLDHATAIVIGQTAVVGNNVSIMQEVTLGGTGKESGDRHPKIGDGVLIGAGSKVLGNIKVGLGAKIGAGSVVLADVKEHTTVAGIPARVVGKCSQSMPSLDMDQQLDVDTLCTAACGIACIKR